MGHYTASMKRVRAIGKRLEGRMNLKIGPWREVELLRERLQHYDGWLASAKADRDMWKAEWGQMYKALMASQKGCVRLRRRLNKLLGRVHP